MLTFIEDTLQKNCLVGLSYFNVQEKLLKQTILAGKVVSVDEEMGITIALFDKNMTVNSQSANFILPSDLSCWFNAPKGEFHTTQADVKIINPDYLVTWDIYQTKADENSSKQDGEQQWWKWLPRTEKPEIG